MSQTTRALTVIRLLAWGTDSREIAARIVVAGKPVAVVNAPMVRTDPWGHWGEESELRFRDACRQVAQQLGGVVEFR
jgi:hypothetical protein